MPGKLGELVTLGEPQVQTVEQSRGWNADHSVIRGKLQSFHKKTGGSKEALCKEAGGGGGGTRESNRKLGKRWWPGSTTPRSGKREANTQ